MCLALGCVCYGNHSWRVWQACRILNIAIVAKVTNSVEAHINKGTHDIKPDLRSEIMNERVMKLKLWVSG